MEDHWDAEPALCAEEALDGVGQLRHRARVLSLPRIARASDLPQPAPALEGGLGFLGVEVAVGIDQLLGLLQPDAHHLGGLLFQRHPCKQVLNPLFRAQA